MILKCNMESKEEEEVMSWPVSPSSQYLRSSALSLTILAVLESEIPIDDSITIPLLKDLFLPISPRFSSIMITESNGTKKWKRVKVNLENHVFIPEPPHGISLQEYDECFTNYLSKLATEQLPEDRPLWEIHVIKYPTSNAAGNWIFKLHHSLGDGYSLMGALLSCLKRLDNPSLPVTFPSRQSTKILSTRKSEGFFTAMPRFFTRVFNTFYDFGFNFLSSTFMEDDLSPVRSGIDRVEFRPIIVINMAFSIDRIKQIKNKLKVTINDVITGVIIYGTRLYMEAMDKNSGMAKATALVLLNTRAAGQGYKSVKEMIKPNAEMPWGNHFAFLPIPLPKLSASKSSNPLTFVMDAHRMIKRQRSSASVLLTGTLLETMRKINGSEVISQFIYATLKNSTMGMTNVIGPVEQLALANHPIKGIYFTMAGPPQSLSVTMLSYVGTLRVAFAVEKEYIDPSKFSSSIETSFDTIFRAAFDPSFFTK